jgi:response regulator NasT
MARHSRVLIADDDKSVTSSLHSMLEKLGCYEIVAVVDNGEKAVEVSGRLLPDLALLDIEMPGIDGLTAARQISAEHDIPVIILSAHSHPNLVDQAVQEGVIQYLVKPATAASLHAAIQTTLAQHEEVKALRENVTTLETTLRERKLIERAKGILMSRRGLTEPEAFRHLQRQSQDRRIPMARLAEMIVQAEELLEGAPPAAGPRAPDPRMPRGD